MKIYVIRSIKDNHVIDISFSQSRTREVLKTNAGCYTDTCEPAWGKLLAAVVVLISFASFGVLLATHST